MHQSLFLTKRNAVWDRPKNVFECYSKLFELALSQLIFCPALLVWSSLSLYFVALIHECVKQLMSGWGFIFFLGVTVGKMRPVLDMTVFWNPKHDMFWLLCGCTDTIYLEFTENVFTTKKNRKTKKSRLIFLAKKSLEDNYNSNGETANICNSVWCVQGYVRRYVADRTLHINDKEIQTWPFSQCSLVV